MRRLTTFVAVSFIFLGCTTSNNFVVLRDVPPNPSFTIIAANDYLFQHEFANQVEETLVNLGVSVITPPASKEVMTKKGVTSGMTEKGMLGLNSADSAVVEKYYTLDESTADYLIFTESNSKRVKIVKRTARQVIASFKIVFIEKEALKKEMYKVLKELNIPVKNPPKEPVGFQKVFQ